ncbi:MAG: isochorismatase family protein [Nitrososphaerales archaeon]
MVIKLDGSCALIIVDMQNDFMPTGRIPVPDADKIVPVLNKYVEIFLSNKLRIFATRDWHPPNHISFKQRGGFWPMHCVKDTTGADFQNDLKIPRSITIISKGSEADKEAYSGFEGTDLARKLEQNSIERILVGGVATDYCVKNTVLDALRLGLNCILLEDAVKGIRNGEEALKEMLSKGANITSIDKVED